jgi:aspartyl-tRNA(Asn)/glutamyl-tRNA(Gln) amidotransferase subunit C
MLITDEMVDYVAELSRLELGEEEKARVREELASIVDYVDILSTVDTEGVEAMSHVFPVHNVFRADEVQPSQDRAELLANAPKTDGEGFLVPKTVE